MALEYSFLPRIFVNETKLKTRLPLLPSRPLKLAQHARSPYSELSHIDADAISTGNIRSIEPTPDGIEQQFPWEQQASGQPIRFLFLVWIASEKRESFNPVHLLQIVTKENVCDFVCDIALVSATRCERVVNDD